MSLTVDLGSGKPELSSPFDMWHTSGLVNPMFSVAHLCQNFKIGKFCHKKVENDNTNKTSKKS